MIIYNWRKPGGVWRDWCLDQHKHGDEALPYKQWQGDLDGYIGESGTSSLAAELCEESDLFTNLSEMDRWIE